MSTSLTIAIPDMRRLAGIDSADTSQDSALQDVRDSEQPVVEYWLDSTALAAALSDSGLLATLTLGATEVLTSRYLQQQARAPGALDDFKVGPVQVTASKQVSALALAQQLGATGASRLAPYGKAASAAPGGPGQDILPSPPPGDPIAESGCLFDAPWDPEL